MTKDIAPFTLKIFYEDNHLLVVEKPPNIPAQSDPSGDMDLLSMLKSYIKSKYNKPGEVYLGLVHRLDRPVGGIMVFARTSKAAARLSNQFAGNTAHKRYAAVVLGDAPAALKLTDYLTKDGWTHNSKTVHPNTPGAKLAVLEFSRMAHIGGLSLLDITLYTGRHHQIRVQLNNAGFPIWGDQRYNSMAVPGQQIALWAYSLEFEHPTLNTKLRFFSMPPEALPWLDFKNMLLGLCADLPLIYNDDNIAVVDKPAGIAVASLDAPGQETLETKLAAKLGIPVYPVHRLDFYTRGLVVFALNDTSKQALDDAIKNGKLHKQYHCIVKGVPLQQGIIKAYAIKDAQSAKVQVFDLPRPGALEMLTGIKLLKSKQVISLIEVSLITGRTHQIRAHLAHIGHPVLGDDKYGDWELNRRCKLKQQALKAVRIEFEFKHGVLSYLNGTSFETVGLYDEFDRIKI